jgi:hypothetical protein
MGQEEDYAFVPPTPDRVCRRAFVLAAVACRASLEEAPQDPDAVATFTRLQKWLAEEDLRQEFEAAEWERVTFPLGTLKERDRIDMSWRSEGLVVLAWALQRAELPPHDQQADGPAVGDTIGFLGKGAARELMSDARLRSEDELSQFTGGSDSIHFTRSRSTSLISLGSANGRRCLSRTYRSSVGTSRYAAGPYPRHQKTWLENAPQSPVSDNKLRTGSSATTSSIRRSRVIRSTEPNPNNRLKRSVWAGAFQTSA